MNPAQVIQTLSQTQPFFTVIQFAKRCLPIAFSILSLSPAIGEQADRNVTQSSYAVTRRDGNQKIRTKITTETNPFTGKVTAKTNSYIELAIANAHLVNGQWVDSSDQIEITRTGARAVNSQHKVEFLGNINSAGAIRITLPEGDKHLVSTPIGLSYFDTASGKSVMIAELKDSVGQLLPSGNQVLYPDAFTDISADILYVNTVSGFEQLIVLREQPPSPAEWGLNPETSVIQVITEFLNPPVPQITPRNVGGMPDEHLDFGITQMPGGFAFALGAETNAVVVTKQWLKLDGRQCLVESTAFSKLALLLKKLPAQSTQAILYSSPDSVIHKVAKGQLLPTRNFAAANRITLQLASSAPDKAGVAIDYTTATSQTNFTFQADTTYYVSSNVTLSGTVTIEGGTVIKYSNSSNAKISVSSGATLICKTGPFRPAVFTSKDDNTVGETITGSTGSPTNTGAMFLDGPDSNTTYENLRFTYAGTAIHALSPQEARHCQFLNCSTAISGDNNVDLKLRNVLLALCGTGVYIGTSNSLVGEHVTADQLNKFFDASPALTTCKLTNCILTSITNALGTNVSLFFCTTNISGNPIFQTVGAAGYYLINSSTNRDAGTTNISTNLLAELKIKTTYPPNLWTNDFTTNATLTIQATRDTNTPDKGYHYDPLDYVVSGRTVTNSTVTLTNGVAIGTYGTGGSYGIYIRKGGNLVSKGSATNLNHIVRYNTVQEQSTTNWSDSTAADCIKSSADSGTLPKGTFRFTGWSLLGGNGYHFNANYLFISTTFSFQDCQFGGGSFNGAGCGISITNCLFDRVKAVLDDGGTGDWPIYSYNNLYRGGTLTVSVGGVGAWLKDNLFDKTTLGGGSFGLIHDYNGYVTNYSRLSPNGTHDKILTNSPVYQTSWLGSYYYPTNDGMLSVLIDAGSRNATNAVMYHYTTKTNQVKETSSTVDIGFHYVATDANGKAIDSDSDGIADYAEDVNGNGVYDSGTETDWLH